MIQKKVCMLGAFAVGKTSLVGRFVSSIFSDRYHSTVGVKIDKKTIDAGGDKMNMLLWDLAGEDEFNRVQTSYLRGASGYLLVADATRSSTVDAALDLDGRAREAVGDVPRMLLVNKMDLGDERDVSEDRLAALEAEGWTVVRTSAKSGVGVDEAFHELARRMKG